MRLTHLAVDVSNYTGPISLNQARCLREHGVEHLIAGTQVPSVTRVQLEAALAAGLSVDAYVYLYWRRDAGAEVRRALDAVSGLPIVTLWLDCEDDAAGFPPSQVLDLIAAALAACGDAPAGIYTGRWWWTPATANSSRFAHLPLWHAEYTHSPAERPGFAAFRSYGGWTRPAMWQFQGTTSLCGATVDLNLRDAATQPISDHAPAFMPGSEVPSASSAALSPQDRDKVELALLRAGQRFDRARALGRYVFRPASTDAAAVELQRVEDGRGVSFDPPVLLPVD